MKKIIAIIGLVICLSGTARAFDPMSERDMLALAIKSIECGFDVSHFDLPDGGTWTIGQ